LVLVIRGDLVDEIMAHARREHPAEVCGVVAGPEDTDEPSRVIEMTNIAVLTGDQEVDDRNRAYLKQLRGEDGTVEGEDGTFEGRERTEREEYAYDSAEWYNVIHKEMGRNDEWPVILYHSHTPRGATPSGYDAKAMTGPASDPRTHYVIVSTWEGAEPTVAGHEFRSYKVVDGEVVEEEVQVVETYMFAHTGADDVPDRG
jgi:proteasome lid subunit RPN8/RPN11